VIFIIQSKQNLICKDNEREAKNDFSYKIASVDRAIELLFILESSQRDMGVTELSKLLGVQKSATHNLLQTLLARGIVQQTDTGRYTLGLRLMRLGSACAERLDVRRLAHPVMTELAAETGEVIILAMLGKDEIVLVDKVEPLRSFFIIPRFDYANTFHCTAVGKILLASAPPMLLERLINRGLERFTPYTNNNKDVLLDELAKIRENGVAIACNETIEGVTCIAAPIHDAKGAVVAALSITSASSWLTPDRYEPLIRSLKQKTTLISHKLGFGV